MQAALLLWNIREYDNVHIPYKLLADYRYLRRLGHSADSARRNVSAAYARDYGLTVAEVSAKLDYQLSQEANRPILGGVL